MEALATYQAVLIRDLLHLVPECERSQVLESAYQHCVDLSPTIRRQAYFAVCQDCKEFIQRLERNFEHNNFTSLGRDPKSRR